MRRPFVGMSALLPALLSLSSGCQPRDPHDSSEARKLDASELDALLPQHPSKTIPGQKLRAAGVEVTVPESWTLSAESPDDPNFAEAVGGDDGPMFAPMCTIELRRQGMGPLPKGTRAAPVDEESRDSPIFDYTRGSIRGRLRELPGPTADSRVLVNCRASRKSTDWSAIQDAFDSLRLLEPAAAFPPQRAPLSPESVLELCTAQPVRRTQVCARRHDGAVYCGPTEGTVLERILDLPPAVELACHGARSCIRDEEGTAWCWQTGEAPVSLASLGTMAALSDACLITQDGRALCAEPGGSARPIDAASFTALELPDHPEAVRAVLDGSGPESGCALFETSTPRCWGELAGRWGTAASTLAELEAGTLSEWSGRLCVALEGGASPGQWSCADEDGQQRHVEDCGARPCRCTATGSAAFNCEHEPHARVDLRPLARVPGVVARENACLATEDGAVWCRGPDPSQPPAEREGPGILHALELR